jgi:hypothetical protein
MEVPIVDAETGIPAVVAVPVAEVYAHGATDYRAMFDAPAWMDAENTGHAEAQAGLGGDEEGERDTQAGEGAAAGAEGVGGKTPTPATPAAIKWTDARMTTLLTMMTCNNDDAFHGLVRCDTWGDFRGHPPSGGYVGFWRAVYKHWLHIDSSLAIAEDHPMSVQHKGASNAGAQALYSKDAALKKKWELATCIPSGTPQTEPSKRAEKWFKEKGLYELAQVYFLVPIPSTCVVSRCSRIARSPCVRVLPLCVCARRRGGRTQRIATRAAAAAATREGVVALGTQGSPPGSPADGRQVGRTRTPEKRGRAPMRRRMAPVRVRVEEAMEMTVRPQSTIAKPQLSRSS